MIEIVERKYIHVCNSCKSELIYENEDVKSLQVGMNEHLDAIVCPVCNTDQIVQRVINKTKDKKTYERV